MVSDRMVTTEMCQKAQARVDALGGRPAMVRLSKVEPELINHVNDEMDQVWIKVKAAFECNGRMCHAVDETLYPTILGVIIGSLEALREGHRVLWDDTEK